MSTADDKTYDNLDMQAELEAAMAAMKTKKPVRASRRKGEVTAPTLALVADESPVEVGAAFEPPAPEPPVPERVVETQPFPAPQAALASPQAIPAAPQAIPAPQAAVGPFPQRAAGAGTRAQAGEPKAPTPRQLAVLLTRAGRRPDGFDLPRDDRRRRVLASCPARVLGPGESARFELAAPDAPGVYELRALQFPSFGAPRLLVEGILLEDHALLSGSASAEAFTTSARESATPFAVLAPESRLTVVVHNVSPTPVPVHPSALLAVLEPRAQQQS